MTLEGDDLLIIYVVVVGVGGLVWCGLCRIIVQYVDFAPRGKLTPQHIPYFLP